MKRLFWLVLIVILAGVLRIWGLANYPPGFTPDEAAFGYNAYSLLKTGHDEWGVSFNKLPLTNFESFGDYKLPLYAFLAVPTVKIFGLNEFATRLPNAIFGTLAVLVIYVLAKKIWSKSAIFAAFLMAISPWGIQLSRGAFEANLVTLLLPLFLVLYLSKKYLFAALILTLNFYSYHSARFLSLILLILFTLKPNPYRLLPILLFIPGMIGLFGSSSSRAADVSILSPTDNWQSVSDARFSAVQSGLPDPIARLFYNKLTYIFTQFTKNYVTYLSPQFLFTEGPKETTYGMHPGTGVMYPIEALFLLAAIYFLTKNKVPHFYILLFTLLLSIMPAALSKGPGYAANRAASMLPFLILLSATGLAHLSKFINKNLLFLLITLSLINFVQLYIYHSRDLAPGMLYGRKEALMRVASLSPAYEQIFVSRGLSEPHIFVAFFNQIDPKIYQQNSKSWQGYRGHFKFLDQYEGYKLDKYIFGSLKFKNPNSLYIGLPQDFPDSQKPMFTIDYPDSSPALIVSRQ